MKKLLIATRNPGKLREIKQFLSDLPFALISLDDVGITEDFREKGETFEENARGKALFYSKKSNLAAISDDGGLEIDALDGAPGVYSRRWIGKKNATTDEYINFTLEKMKSLPQTLRGAQLRAVIALAFPDGKIFTTDAAVRGIIPRTPSTYREKGFPYRSLLFLPDINKFYNGDELTKEEELQYNHRYKGLQKLKKTIRMVYLNQI